jgi:hypothetical protein
MLQGGSYTVQYEHLLTGAKVLAMNKKSKTNLRKIAIISVLGLLGLALAGSFVSPAVGAASSPLMIPHIDPHGQATGIGNNPWYSLTDIIPHIDPHGVASGVDNNKWYGYYDAQNVATA